MDIISAHFLGTMCLACGLLFALLQAILPWFNSIYCKAGARPAAIAQCIFIFSACALLAKSFLQDDFSLLYVALNSHPNLSQIYKISAVWSGHEGSILLWILWLNVWSLFYMTTQKENLSPSVLAILGMICSGFISFSLFSSNPFTLNKNFMLPQDLNPLLQDPGFVLHPPFLYGGYVGFAVCFSYLQSLILRNQFELKHFHYLKKSALYAFALLTLGIVLGSWWSYRVLGWGGFWTWDPVENASLMPWLAGLAFIHVLPIALKNYVFRPWLIFLGSLTFILSLFGTFLVRSGILVSVHTFASDPQRGIFLLSLLTIAIALTSLNIFYFQKKNPPSSDRKKYLPHKYIFLFFQSLIVFTILITIMLATLYPFLLQTLNLGIISIGAPYFNEVIPPFIIGILFLMLIYTYTNTPIFEWRKAISLLIFFGVFSLLAIKIEKISMNLAGFFCFFLSLANLYCYTFRKTNSPLSMRLAHSGFGILILGIILSTALKQELFITLKKGEQAQLASYAFYFSHLDSIQSSNYHGVQGKFTVFKNGEWITDLQPEKRIYSPRGNIISIVAIQSNLFRDLYLALGEPENEFTWSVRIYYNPFIHWIWLGGVLIALGSIVHIWKYKRNQFSAMDSQVDL